MTSAPKLPPPTIIPWKCLQDCSILPPKPSSTSTSPPSTQQKTFTQAVSNVCDIPLSQLPKPFLKGDIFSIEIPEDEYEAGLVTCKHNLHGRVLWPKGSTLIFVENLRSKLSSIWKSIGVWGVTSNGRGFYEFSFSSVEDMRRVRLIGSRNLDPGFLKLFAWTKDFNPSFQQQTTAQVWLQIYGLSQKY